MHEAIIAVDSDGPCANASERTGGRIELWCLDQCDLLSVAGPLEPVVAEVETAVGVTAIFESGTESVLITDTCLRARLPDAIDGYIARHNCLLLPPLVYENGAKHCRVLALDGESLTAWYRALCRDGVPVRVVTKRSLSEGSPMSMETPHHVELTDRQREAMQIAHANGYYDIPREISTAAIAEKLGVERRTAEEHLRRAENKLVDSLMDSI